MTIGALEKEALGQRSKPEPLTPAQRIAKQLAKTRFCKHQLRGYCRYGGQCAYAHSTDELLPRPNFEKTKVCVNFLAGACSDSQCTYAHGFKELRRSRTERRRSRGASSRQSGISDNSSAMNLPPMPATDPSPRSTSPSPHMSRGGATRTSDIPQPPLLQDLKLQWASEVNIPMPVQEAARQAAEEAARRVLAEGVALWREEQGKATAPTYAPPWQPQQHPQQMDQQPPQSPQDLELQQLRQELLHLQQQQLLMQQQQRYDLIRQKQQQQLEQQLLLQQLQQPQQRQPQQSHDWILMREALADVVGMMMEQQPSLATAFDTQGPSRAGLAWGRLARRALQGRRKSALMEGRFMLRCERRGMSQGDEQLIMCMLLREPGWVVLFPELARRCSAAAAMRVQSQIAAAAGPWAPPALGPADGWQRAGKTGMFAEAEGPDRSLFRWQPTLGPPTSAFAVKPDAQPAARHLFPPGIQSMRCLIEAAGPLQGS